MKYTMTDAQYKRLLDACRPTPAIALHCGSPPSQQETANAAWQALGSELNFNWLTVRPVAGEPKSFTAEENK